MGTQQQDNRNPQNQQQGGSKQNTSPRSPGEIGKGGQDAGTMGSPSGQKSDNERGESRDKRDS